MKIVPLTLASLLLCASCSNANNQPNRKTASITNTQEEDVQITNRVKSALVSDSPLNGNVRNVCVETTDGVVTLKGHVPTVDESRNIEQKAKSIKAVSRVDNQLIIKP